jgi:hypothetical protein
VWRDVRRLYPGRRVSMACRGKVRGIYAGDGIIAPLWEPIIIALTHSSRPLQKVRVIGDEEGTRTLLISAPVAFSRSCKMIGPTHSDSTGPTRLVHHSKPPWLTKSSEAGPHVGYGRTSHRGVNLRRPA